MNKILLLSDYDDFPEGAFECARVIAASGPILLTGVFLPATDYWSSLYFSYGVLVPAEEPNPLLTAPADRAAVARFRDLCTQHGIDYRVHELGKEHVLDQLLHETRFADLMIFSSLPFFEGLTGSLYNDYEGTTLHDAECPVLIVPETWAEPDHIILTYDGSASSVFAIRQFAALLPGWTRLPALLAYAHPDEDRQMPDEAAITELASRHYQKLALMKLNLEPREAMEQWISGQKNTLLVAGAKGRVGFSEWFQGSFAGPLLRTHRLPVFLAHR